MKYLEQQPATLDEAVGLLYEETSEYRFENNVTADNIDQLLPHHGFGTALRNELYLWWSEDLAKNVREKNPDSDYPATKPALVQWFNDRNIFHPDDMSGTIMAALKAKLAGEPFDFDSHVQRYYRHWKAQGFKNGICKPENKLR